MSARDDKPRIWAQRDRSIEGPPQREFARQMRASPTEAERKLWWHLRHRLRQPHTHFRRQVRIDRFIADFVCHSARVIVEIDGGQHSVQTAADAERTKVLKAHGYRVLRFWNNDVLTNIDGVLEAIHADLMSTPTPVPSPQGGGEEPAAREPLQSQCSSH